MRHRREFSRCQGRPPYSVVAGSPAKIISVRLSFLPPREIRPCDEHVPYFYEGFFTRVSERGPDSIRLSAPEFVVCLELGGAAKLLLQADGIDRIYSSGEEHPFKQGIAAIPISSLERVGNQIRLHCGKDPWGKAIFKRIWVE